MSKTEMLDALDAQWTDAEWERNRQHAKFLYDCKTKGFARLARLGASHGGIALSEKESAPEHTTFEFATEAAALVNDQGWTISKACEKFGRNAGDLRYYCEKFGIELNRQMRTWDYDATFPKIMQLINRKGYRMKDAAKQLKATPGVLNDILKSKGYKYNATTVKIRKIKT
jgi:hypothetical protein